jgi:hypothetical protein
MSIYYIISDVKRKYIKSEDLYFFDSLYLLPSVFIETL